MKTKNNFQKKYKIRRFINTSLLFIIYFLLLIFFSLLFLGLTGCKKNAFDPDSYAKNQQGNEWALPLLHGSLNINDILSDSVNASSDETGLVTLFYNGEVSSPAIIEGVRIPEINNSNDFIFEMPEYVPQGDSVYVPYSQNIIFDMPYNQRINTLTFNSFLLYLTFETDLNKNARITISIPDAKKNGISYSTSFNYNFSGKSVNTITKKINLEGYTLRFTHSGDVYNIMKIYSEIYVYSNDGPNNSPYYFQITENLSDVSVREFTGYAGQIPFSIYTDTISVDLFKKYINGTLQFNDPRIRLMAINGVGAPASLTFTSIKALFDDPAWQPVELTGPGAPDEWFVSYSLTGSATSVMEIKSSNTNLKELLNSAPDKITVEVTGITNPNGVITKNIINDSSNVTLLTEIELPLYGSADNLTIQDEYDFSFDNTADFRYAEFKVKFSNSFPIDLSLQLYFLDDQKNILDSLFSEKQWIEHGRFNAETLHVTQPAQSVFTSLFDHDKMGKIKINTSLIRVVAQLDTPDNSPVKIYSDNHLDFNIGIKYQK